MLCSSKKAALLAATLLQLFLTSSQTRHYSSRDHSVQLCFPLNCNRKFLAAFFSFLLCFWPNTTNRSEVNQLQKRPDSRAVHNVNTFPIYFFSTERFFVLPGNCLTKDYKILYRLVVSNLTFEGQASRVPVLPMGTIWIFRSLIHLPQFISRGRDMAKAFGNSTGFRFALANFTVSTAVDWYVSPLSGSCTKPGKARGSSAVMSPH